MTENGVSCGSRSEAVWRNELKQKKAEKLITRPRALMKLIHFRVLHVLVMLRSKLCDWLVNSTFFLQHSSWLQYIFSVFYTYRIHFVGKPRSHSSRQSPASWTGCTQQI